MRDDDDNTLKRWKIEQFEVIILIKGKFSLSFLFYSEMIQIDYLSESKNYDRLDQSRGALKRGSPFLILSLLPSVGRAGVLQEVL